MYRSSCCLTFLLLVPTLTFCLALPHRLNRQGIAQLERSSGRAFSLPIHRRRKSNNVGRPGRRVGASGSVGIGDNSDLLYTVPIKLGGITTAVNLDTGSSDLWVISDGCNTDMCKKSTATPYPASSLTSSGTNVTMSYGDSTTGTYASGPIGMDTATIAGLSVLNQQFAAIDNTTNSAVAFGAAGIFGLGFPSESVIQQSVVNQQFNDPATTDQFVASTFQNGPLLSRIISSGELLDPMFAINLQRDTIDVVGSGQLSIGKLPDGVSNSSLTWVPVRLYSDNDGGLSSPAFAPNEMYPYRWEILLEGVYLDGQKLADSTVPGQGVNSTSVSALIDTGNSLIRGPGDVVQNILRTVSPSYALNVASNAAAQATVSCSIPHTLGFQIGGQMFPIDPRDFIGASNGDTSTCLADHVVATDAPSKGSLFSWSLGDPFFKSTLVAFYYGNLTHPSVDPPRIGFLSTVPKNASQLLSIAVESAQQNGKFEATTQVAPTASAASASATTLSIPSLAMPSGTSAPGRSSPKHTDIQNNSAASICCNGLERPILVVSLLVLLSWWI
ncbi:hypothetical protein PILCRDRAFT_722010 [Piloderma croceum F 1598]|uniref:Peptidase A1 domain-containing protein n=1 Tax=Piloderma croceum (strain F 1598) TaxID=765440 RepID=A0A0C3F0K4_PILCF|nr:hypothetical protein PILCRDRAFT_722010 [Piloderma croceum F 1598]